MNYYSDDKQDEFTASILKFKRNGYYLDIGSSSSIGSNNSYFFESLDWKGICIEKDSKFNDSYKTRTCIYINDDALNVNYKQVFAENNFPFIIDYLSIDIDQDSTLVLEKIPFDEYRFKVITIEHDSHVYGDLYKVPQRYLLRTKGYLLLCVEVLNQSGRNIGESHGYEDWWVYPDFFERDELIRLYSYRLDATEIIQKFRNQ